MTDFTGFSDEGLTFLRGLAAHNDRDWFTQHRAVYDDQLKPGLAALIAATSSSMAARAIPLTGDPKASQFACIATPGFPRTSGPIRPMFREP